MPARRPAPDHDPLLAHAPRVLLRWSAENGERRWARRRGTLVLLDVSGFTQLSERLAATGKAGVEEVTALIGGIFTGFLDAAYQDNGSLLKFGGDALLLLFDGEAHAQRAARAALLMRDRLAEVGTLETRLGPVDLRMTTALSTGDVVLLLAGSAHRELVVTGEPAARVVAMGKAAAPGEVLVDGATAEALGAADLGAERGGVFPLHGGIAPPPPPGPDVLEPALDPRPFIPTALRDALAAGHLAGEHRRAAVAFIVFGGLTSLLENDGPEAAAALVDALISRVQSVCDEQSVCFRQCDLGVDGGSIFLVAGAPRTTGHDEDALLRTVRAIVDAEQTLPVRAGVSRGRVFAGVIGTPFRRTYAVMGDTVNVAARLSAHAQWGQVLITPSVLAEARTAYAFTSVPPLTLKGKAAPVAALELAAPLGLRVGPGAADELPLVGRDAEFARLTEALHDAVGGTGSLIEVIGEAGMGKSRLLAALRAAAGSLGTAVHTVSCAPYESSTAYFAVRGLLRHLLEVHPGPEPGDMDRLLAGRLQELDPQLVPFRPLLGVVLDVPTLPTPEVDRLGDAYRVPRLHDLVSVLLARLLPGPTLVCIEDAHWMDQASAALLLHLADVSRLGPWLLCATRRPDGHGFVPDAGTPLRRIELGALDAECSAELARAEATRLMLVPEEAEALAARAGGNPLFLRELLRTAQGRGDEALPETVEAVVTARLDQLAERDRRLLRSVAVLGQSFREDRVARILADGDVELDGGAWIRLAEFVEAGGSGELRFRHDLFREVAYEGLPYRRRRELHARAGADEEQLHAGNPGEIAELLSLHYSRAGIDDRAWQYSLIAADRARAKWANLEALQFYRRAIAAADRLGTVPRRELMKAWEALGDVADLAGHFDEASDAYARAPRMAAEDRVRLLLKQSRVLEQMSQWREGLQIGDRALIASDRIRDPTRRLAQRAEVNLRIAGLHWRLGDHAQSTAFSERAVDEATQAGSRLTLAHAYMLLFMTHGLAGSHQRTRYRELALPIFEELGDLTQLGDIYNNVGIEEYYRGHWPEAMAYYRRAMEAREQAGHVAGRALGLNNIAEILSDQGHLDQAQKDFHTARQMALAINYTMLVHVADGNLGRAAARAGRRDEADGLLQRAHAGFEEIGARAFVLETRTRQAELALLSGRLREALTATDALLVEIRGAGDQAVREVALHRVRAAALARMGRCDDALTAISASVTRAIDADAGYEMALSLSVQAGIAERLGRDDLASARTEAGRLLDGLGVVWTPDLLAGSTGPRAVAGGRPS